MTGIFAVRYQSETSMKSKWDGAQHNINTEQANSNTVIVQNIYDSWQPKIVNNDSPKFSSCVLPDTNNFYFFQTNTRLEALDGTLGSILLKKRSRQTHQHIHPPHNLTMSELIHNNNNIANGFIIVNRALHGLWLHNSPVNPHLGYKCSTNLKQEPHWQEARLLIVVRFNGLFSFDNNTLLLFLFWQNIDCKLLWDSSKVVGNKRVNNIGETT